MGSQVVCSMFLPGWHIFTKPSSVAFLKTDKSIVWLPCSRDKTFCF
jgi:hypothetical protein